MKSFFFSFVILVLLFIIGCNAFSSNILLTKERRESYQACIKLRNKAPNLNLKCENLLEKTHSTEAEREVTNNTGVKFLSDSVVSTRKVNKSEEIKLRNLIKKLTSENKLRKD